MAALTNFALFLLLFISAFNTFQACPVNCGNNQYCNDQNRCVCNKNFFGNDCSIQATELFLNTPQTSIPFGKSVYFYFSIKGKFP